MTLIKIAKRDGELIIEAIGHATGSPEACAGISALMGAWSCWCWRQGGDTDEGDGEYSGTCKCTRAGEDVLRTIAGGLERIRLAVPGALQIDVETDW